MPLKRAALGCHSLLIGALAAGLALPPTAAGLVLAAVVCLPLLLTLRGLVLARRTPLQRLAVLLVAYVGGTSVEVVARSGAAPLFSIALLAAVIELGLLLALIRRSASRPRSDPARTES